MSTFEKYYCNLCSARTDRLYQSEHWDGSLLMLCRACATELIDPQVRGINHENPDALRHRAHEIVDRELQRRRVALEAESAYLAERQPLVLRLHRLMRELYADDLSDANRRALEAERSRIQAKLDTHRRLYETARDARGSSSGMAL